MNKAGFFMILLLSCFWSIPALCVVKPHPGSIIIGGRVINNDPDPHGDFKTITVPIKRAGNLIVVEAQLDTLIGNFILDTGAPGLILNQTYFRDARHIDEKESAGINGSAGQTFTTIVYNFAILDLHYDRITADVTDLSHIENSKGIKVLGLLGTHLFAKLAITIDLFNNVLYIHKLGNKGEILPGERPFTTPDMRTSFKLLNDVIFIKGSVEDQSMWFAFDTGAECNLLDQGNYKKLAKHMQILSKATVTGVGGKGSEVKYVLFEKMVIGNYLFRHNRILFTRLDQISNAYGNSVDAILGHDFFARGIFTINFAKKELEMYIYTHQDK
ncbi:MAG TPA: aspartyl protease family protein [Mucilaginibacter sp.]|nr:aspartyl protease family protein [Mucilaginibacter sp.]